jgi:phosphohistidine phosphatase
MKTILFLRHAKSSWAEPGLRDHDRPLNNRGKRDAPRMAEKLKNIYPEIDQVFVSTSQRTRATIHYFKEAFGTQMRNISFEPSLYHGSPSDYQDVLIQANPSSSTILMVGHNPGITQVANDCNASNFIDNVPTTGIFALESEALDWEEVNLTACSRTLFIYPKMYA